MKKAICFSIVILLCVGSFAQSDSLLNSLQTDTLQELLPAKMVFTQRVMWGQKGLIRSLGLAPLTAEHREKELKLRRKMLVAHQVLGFATLGGFVAQGIVGGKLYNNYSDKLKNTHEGIATAINTTYTLAALTALTAPPPLINRDRGLSSIRLHKWLSVVHLTGMIATNVLAGQITQHPNLKPYHKAAAYTTFASYAASVLVLKF